MQLKHKINLRIRFLYSIVIIVIIFVAAVAIYFNKKERADTNKKINNSLSQKTNNRATETLPETTDFKSVIERISEPVINNAYRGATYKIIDANGKERELYLDELLQNSIFYKNIKSGEIYYVVYENSCTDEDIYKLKPLENIKSEDFFVYQKDGRYATNLKSVYFDERKTDFDCEENYEMRILKNADPKTFEPNIETEFDVSQGNTFRGLYSRDLKTVFYGSEILEGVDAPTFKLWESVSITSDKNHIYLRQFINPNNAIIINADPSTYAIIQDYSSSKPGIVLGKDKNYVFVDNCLLNGVDSSGFLIVNDEPFLIKDKKFTDKTGIFAVKIVRNKSGEIASCGIVRNTVN